MTWDKINPGFGSGLGYGRMDPASDGMWCGAALKEEGNGPWRNLPYGGALEFLVNFREGL